MADEKSRGTRPKGGAARPRREPPLYAAVDLGTNNCRLLIAAPRGDSFVVVDSYSQVARLGEGLASTGRLSDAAIERAMDALKKISQKIKARKVGRVRCIATEACRKADNGRAFIDRVREETGLTFKIIRPQEEAQLALIGCHTLIDPQASKVLVLDIGGGSTELSLVDASRVRQDGLTGILAKPPIESWTSLPIGVVTLSETFPDITEEESYPLMVERARMLMSQWKAADAVRAAFAAGDAHIIGTSGTVTCVAGVHLKLDRYRRDLVDGIWMSEEESRSTMTMLREAGPEGRAKFPTIGNDRANLMLSGCAIVEAAWELAAGGRMRVADRGLREGLLLSMIRGPKRGNSRRKPGKSRRRRRSKPTAEAQHGG